jgi:hypothetical protein
MVAIGPRGTAYAAVAFEIFADLYYRTTASVNGALGHAALGTLLSDDTALDLRAALATRVLAALRLGLAPALGDDPLRRGSTETADAAAAAALADDSGPAAFALLAVWSRLSEDPPAPGMLGAAYLAAQVTAQALRQLKSRWPDAGVDAGGGALPSAAEIAAFGAQAERFATHIRHLLLETLTDAPEAAALVLRGFDRLSVVFPLPLLDEAVAGAMDSREVA